MTLKYIFIALDVLRRSWPQSLALTLSRTQEMARGECHRDWFQGLKLSGWVIQSIRFHQNRLVEPDCHRYVMMVGKKDKLRPGDILGALM